MKNFFSKLFSKNPEEESILSIKYLNEIYSYLYNENPNLSFKLNGFFDKIFVNLYSFPESFDNPKSKSELKNCNFTDIYEVLNSILSKIDIEILSEELIAEKYPVDYIHIQFYSNLKTSDKVTKNIVQNFILFFSCDDGSEEINSFRILYSNNRYFSFYLRNLLDLKFIPNNVPKGEFEINAFKDFETVLIGICQYMKIELPKKIDINLLTEEAEQRHFIDFFRLINRNAVDEKIIEKVAKKMFVKFQKSDADYDFIVSNYKYLEQLNVWNSDWKFEAEDAIYFISEMINQDFTFDYPEETYSHNLFPYIQFGLEKDNFELLSFDTQGDNYLFFVVNKSDVDKILELSQIIGVKVDKL